MLKAYKKIGQTPLELLDEIREQKPELKNETLSYAGRLDPLAEGEMLIMVGKEENCSREEFLKYDKTYEADILFGFSTDTYDVMGLINEIYDFKKSRHPVKSDPYPTLYSELTKKDLKKSLKKIKKIEKLPYPVFSSKTFAGKPLFWWYKNNKISEIEIPETKIKIKKVKLLETNEISEEDLFNYIYFVVGEVKGDFRQEEILAEWRRVLSYKNDVYKVAKVKFKVSSGTYIRSLANEIGKEMGVPACLLKLKRTKIHN